MLRELIASYDGFLVDLWGVIHDGTTLYPGVADTLTHLHMQDKPVLFLSNAPRVAAKAEAVLGQLGIPRQHYRHVVTSGQVAHDWLKSTRPFGTQYYYLGPTKDEDIIRDLAPYKRVGRLEEADFVLNTGYEYDLQPHAEILPLLEEVRSHKLPLLCVNPDHEVVKQDGTQWLCAGAVAAEYETMGGEVVYVGKPHRKVYDVCRAMLPGKLLAIGDNPLTDIRGANEAGIDSLLITGGVLSVSQKKLLNAEEALAYCAPLNSRPTYVLPSFTL